LHGFRELIFEVRFIPNNQPVHSVAMSHMNPDSISLDRLRAQLHRASCIAEQSSVPAELIEAIRAADALCSELVNSASTPARRFQGHLDYTFDDESYQPNGRQVDVRVYFNWNDYDPADGPVAEWGAVIESVEVLAVRNFDHLGNAVDSHSHLQDVARELLEQNEEVVREACTQEGVRLGIGRSHPFYRPAYQRPPQVGIHVAPSRMAPSARTRQPSSSLRKLG
jgi:hypothetical protein